MATIRDIAKKAKVSPGTVSFVLNGKGDQMRIATKTQEKILKIAKDLGYLPSISARRLRNSESKHVPVISILWTLDTRASLISRFLKGIQKKSVYKDNLFEILIQPYENGKLSELESLRTGNKYNGAIIANASDEDLQYIEDANLKVPIVLYQRRSNKYSTVNVDGKKTGLDVAKFLYEKHQKNVGIIVPNLSSQAVSFRQEGFIEGVNKMGINNICVQYGDFSEKGGYEVMESLIKQSSSLPEALFFLSDPMAVGALSASHDYGIRVPEDLKIIGHDNDDQTSFTVPSLTTVHLPVEEMAGACVNQLIGQINQKIETPTNEKFQTSIIVRNSC
ncbi:LacI family DNA-binding transcriptional regulator [Gracilibacillus salitolerans]|uniref:LacI family DNA-binding transcriptional regulator n=1 Tax=Gracilibacillus salitolerans TaxID=2663022 RepID=A0A5Q2TTS5_9BACI|nr:LacI family DNA-binding transcriptional regulator [Gracilibacillus salitolerans]QGH36188.1 LacI family DNA-binding transcriptional regulator [Gracilibacillus salitolerans]